MKSPTAELISLSHYQEEFDDRPKEDRVLTITVRPEEESAEALLDKWKAEAKYINNLASYVCDIGVFGEEHNGEYFGVLLTLNQGFETPLLKGDKFQTAFELIMHEAFTRGVDGLAFAADSHCDCNPCWVQVWSYSKLELRNESFDRLSKHPWVEAVARVRVLIEDVAANLAEPQPA
jgi:hypothetical protein